MPSNGITVIHFSFLSGFSNHGLSTSPFGTRLEWKYLLVRGTFCPVAKKPELFIETGFDAYGVANGLVFSLNALGVPLFVSAYSMLVVVLLLLCMNGDLSGMFDISVRKLLATQNAQPERRTGRRGSTISIKTADGNLRSHHEELKPCTKSTLLAHGYHARKDRNHGVTPAGSGAMHYLKVSQRVIDLVSLSLTMMSWSHLCMWALRNSLMGETILHVQYITRQVALIRCTHSCCERHSTSRYACTMSDRKL